MTIRYQVENVDKVLLDNDLVVYFKSDTVHYMEKPHFHNGFEIHFTLTNETSYHVDGRRYMADSGTVALFGPQEIHRVSIDKNKIYERYFILFKPSFIEEFTSNYPNLLDLYTKVDLIQLSEDKKIKMVTLFRELLLIKSMEKELNNLLSKIKIIEILILLNKQIEKNINLPKTNLTLNQTLLSKMISFIKENYMYDITLDILSEKYFISKSTINRLFRISMGMTPNQYLIYTRIMSSRDYLEKGYTVKEVASQIGYKDESSFIKKFREIQGESPKQYALKILRS